LYNVVLYNVKLPVITVILLEIYTTLFFVLYLVTFANKLIIKKSNREKDIFQIKKNPKYL